MVGRGEVIPARGAEGYGGGQQRGYGRMACYCVGSYGGVYEQSRGIRWSGIMSRRGGVPRGGGYRAPGSYSGGGCGGGYGDWGSYGVGGGGAMGLETIEAAMGGVFWKPVEVACKCFLKAVCCILLVRTRCASAEREILLRFPILSREPQGTGSLYYSTAIRTNERQHMF